MININLGGKLGDSDIELRVFTNNSFKISGSQIILYFVFSLFKGNKVIFKASHKDKKCVLFVCIANQP